MLESKEEILKALKEIDKWEKDQKGLWIWERIGRIPFRLLDKATPAFIQKKISVMLDELGHYLQSGGKYLTNKKMVLQKLNKLTGTSLESIEDIRRLPLADMKGVCLQLMSARKTAAALQGATTGFGGVFTLAADIPVLLGLSLKTLQEMAVAHGYDPNTKEERIFIVKCLQFASADTVGKEAILNKLSSFQDRSKPSEVFSQLQGWREVIYSYRDTYGWKKLLQTVPVAGVIFGAFTNRSLINDVAEAGMMLYQKRRALERLEQHEENSAPQLN